VTAVDALCDEELQNRLWLNGERLTPDETSFGDSVNTVIDELKTDDLSELVGHVLRDENELDGFSRLVRSLQALVDVIGPLADIQDALNSGPACRRPRGGGLQRARCSVGIGQGGFAAARRRRLS
jgi:hypothetical protein